MSIEPVQRVLDALGVSYALIGGHALAARGYPRFTVDVDLLTSDPRVLERSIWAELERAGAAIDPRRGDADDPLGGVVHILLADGTDVDLVVARWAWQARIVERAELLAVGVPPIRVPRTSDLILLKLGAGGFGDLQDAAALLAVADRAEVVRQVEACLDEVPPEVGSRWRDLLRG